jgi:ABC-type Fe3+/spermidine/putrescine transport system ATPase subunit
VGEANFIRGILVSKKGERSKVSDKAGRNFIASNTVLETGMNVVAGIKTEFTMMTKEKRGRVNNFNGTIERKLFLGRFTDFEVVLSEGGIVHARLPGAVADKFKEGDNVFIHYAPGRLLIFPEPEEGLKRELEME